MGTSAIIHVQGCPDIYLYKHWDGQPESTLPWLKKFNHEFTQKRGDDPPYKFAQLLRSSAFDAKMFNLDDSRTTGWGVYRTPSLQTVSDFEYVLLRDGNVDVMEKFT